MTVAFVSGFLVGAALVLVILGRHFVTLVGDLREQIVKLQIELHRK